MQILVDIAATTNLQFSQPLKNKVSVDSTSLSVKSFVSSFNCCYYNLIVTKKK